MTVWRESMNHWTKQGNHILKDYHRYMYSLINYSLYNISIHLFYIWCWLFAQMLLREITKLKTFSLLSPRYFLIQTCFFCPGFFCFVFYSIFYSATVQYNQKNVFSEVKKMRPGWIHKIFFFSFNYSGISS